MALEDQVNISTDANASIDPLAGSDLDTQAKQAALEQRALQADALTRSKPITQALDNSTQSGANAGITNQDLFPGMNQPINVGSSSSQTLGSQPIFVASGQYLPLNVLNKKEAAIEKASQARLARQMKFDPGKAAKLNNPLYQQELNDKFAKVINDFTAEAKSLHGQEFDLALGSQSTDIGRRFATAKRNLATLADQQNVVFDRVAKVNAAKEKGGATVYSQDTQDKAFDLQNRLNDFATGGDVDVVEAIDDFYGSHNLDTYLNDNKILSGVKADIASRVARGEDYHTIINEEKYDRFIDDFASSLTSPGGQYEGDDLVTEDVIKKNLASKLGRGAKVKKSIKMKPTPAHIGKAKTKKELIQARFETERAVIKNPSSDLAKQTVNSLRGKAYANGILSESGYSTPKDFDKSRNAATTFEEYYKSNKDKTEGRFIKDNVFDKGAKKKIEEILSEVGIRSNKIEKVKLDKDDPNKVSISDLSGKSTVFDMSTDEGKEAFEDYIITLSGEDPKFKNKTAIKVNIYDRSQVGKKKDKVEYWDVDAPETWANLNEILNIDAGEGNEVTQPELNVKIKEAGLLDSGSGEGDQPDVDKRFEAYKATEEYKARFKKWQDANKEVDPKQIEAAIKQRYK